MGGGDADTDSDTDSDVDTDTDIDTDPDPASDDDQDGFVQADDCDDGDPTVFPGAPELCDGKDNDCDNVEEPGDRMGSDGVLECSMCDSAGLWQTGRTLQGDALNTYLSSQLSGITCNYNDARDVMFLSLIHI